jgi:hypothetical protein
MLDLLFDETRWFSKYEGSSYGEVRCRWGGSWAPEPEGLVAHPVSLSFFHVRLSLAIQVCLVSANSRRTNYHDFLFGCDGHFLAFM